MRTLVTGMFLAWLGLTGAVVEGNAADGPLNGSQQILLVLTDGWESVNGTMQRFERSTLDAPWRAVGPAVPIVVGKNGLAWGRGLVSNQGNGKIKREGDGRSPAGVFRLSSAFGQTRERPPGWQLPYRNLDDNVECVDDATSASYNQLTTRSGAARADWSSSEKMWQEPLYQWGVVVDHNAAPAAQPGAGSCIFLHIWKGPDHGTAGCTAMGESALTTTIGWLAPARHPLLVQLTRAEYDRLKSAWGLP